MKKKFQDDLIRKHIENRIRKMNKRYSETDCTSLITKQNNEKILEQESVVLGRK